MKTQKITSTRTVYLDECSICKKEIKGFSENNLKYNMRLHKEKHENDKPKKEKKK